MEVYSDDIMVKSKLTEDLQSSRSNLECMSVSRLR